MADWGWGTQRTSLKPARLFVCEFVCVCVHVYMCVCMDGGMEVYGNTQEASEVDFEEF